MSLADIDQAAAQSRLEAAQQALESAGDDDTARNNAVAEIARAEAMLAAATDTAAA
jgi:F0F1-type ATP synthase epsilon subunit